MSEIEVPDRREHHDFRQRIQKLRLAEFALDRHLQTKEAEMVRSVIDELVAEYRASHPVKMWRG